MARTRKAAKAAAPVEDDVFEDIDEGTDDALDDLEDPTDDDLDDLDDAPAEEEPKPKRGRKAAAAKAAPAKKAPAKKAAAPVADDDAEEKFDSNWLAEFVNDACGTSYDSRAIRMLLRKLAGDGVISREVGVDRSRYEFPKGANDPTVRAVIKAVKSGAVEKAKRENIETAKATAAKKTAPPAKKTAKAAPAKTTTRRRRAE